MILIVSVLSTLRVVYTLLYTIYFLPCKYLNLLLDRTAHNT